MKVNNLQTSAAMSLYYLLQQVIKPASLFCLYKISVASLSLHSTVLKN